MLKHLLSVSGILCITSSLFATLVMDPDTGFVADTVITAGEQEVPCEIITNEGSGVLQGTSGHVVIYRDSLGRTIRWGKSYSNSKTNSRGTKYYESELDSCGRVARIFGSSRSSTMSFGQESSDTLTGKKWNELGLIKAGILMRSARNSQNNWEYSKSSFRVWIQYDSTKLRAIDTTYYSMEGFYPDTVIEAGEAKVLCQYEDSSTIDTSSIIYRDSLGRKIQYTRRYRCSNVHNGQSHSNLLELDSTGEKVLQEKYRYTFSWPGGQTCSNKLLVGEVWNEQGMITEGTIFGKYWSSQDRKTTSRDTTRVSIVYDSSGILPIDTIYPGDPTATLTEKQMSKNVISVCQQNNRITLNGVQKGTDIVLYTPSGRILLNEVCQKNDVAELPIGTLSPGIYFLNVGGKTSFKVLHK